MADGTIRYRAPGPAALLRHDLDGLTAFFHRPSGQTHLVLEPVPEILALLAEEPADAATLAKRLGRRFRLEGKGEPVELVAARLAELEALGLVMRDA